MKNRSLLELIELAQRVEAYCDERVYIPEVDARWNHDTDEFRAGRIGTDEQNIYAVSRVARWVLSWNKRRATVARALVAAMPAGALQLLATEEVRSQNAA